MKNTPTFLSVRQGATVELPCVASGYPLPRYSWSRDGDVIILDSDSTGNKSRVQLFGGNLVIESATVTDNGEYICTAENSLGSRSASVRLEVKGQYNVVAS